MVPTSWPRPTNKYDVHVSALATQGGGWTPLGADGEDKCATEMENLGNIRVDREVEMSRPKNAYYAP